MKNFFRKYIKIFLAKLASYFIYKNKIKIISVFGNHQADMAVDAIYTVIKEKGNVSRNYVDFEKDLDVPFFILTGRENFTLFSFFILLFKYLFLLYNTKNKNKIIILNITTYSASVIKYYSLFMHSDLFLILDITNKSLIYEEEIMKNSKKDASIIIDGDSNLRKLITLDFSKKLYSFGTKPNNDLIYISNPDKIDITYNENHMELHNNFKDIDVKVIAASILVCIIEGISFHNAISSIQEFRLPNKKFQKVFEKFIK